MSPSRPDDEMHSERISEESLRAWPLPEPDGAGGKETRGTVLVIGGAGGIAPGAAARLAERAATASAVLIGPGMLDEPSASRLVQELARLIPAVPLVLDAAALEALRDAPAVLAGREGGALAMPHAGE